MSSRGRPRPLSSLSPASQRSSQSGDHPLAVPPQARLILDDALDLVRQGYTPAHAERVTGWAAPVITAQATLRWKTSTA